jgi:aminoglycoside/choline kinase family phosphotransferase
MQPYDLPRFPVVHVDLYRIAAAAELAEIGFAEAREGAVMIVEWPERAGDMLPGERLEVALRLAPRLGPTYRSARITGRGSFAARVERMVTIRKFLDEAGFADAERAFLQGDASTRSYERLVLGERHAVLMNAPRRPDGPPVRDGLSYSAIAHLAEDVKPFVAMARALRERDFSAPQVHAADLADGLLILEDLGSETITAGNPPAPIEERYEAAVDVLVALHHQKLPAVLSIAPRVRHRLPRYDLGAFLIEVELLLDWYLPYRGRGVDDAMRVDFAELWRASMAPVFTAPQTWVLRDYHSPNLLWLPRREGIARVGLLDFQDAQVGPAAYDLVSLLQDARADIPETLEVSLLGRYAKAHSERDPAADASAFIETYALLGAQRATKILGIFARLDRRDGKPQYLRHLPRVWRYLSRSLGHPSLATLKAWYETNVPPP